MSQSVTVQEGITTVPKKSNYRWLVIALICVTYCVAYADRANLGVALPSITKEFNLTNTEAGALVSILFFCYSFIQIPAGFLYTKIKVGKLFPFSMVMTCVFTFLQGFTSSVFMMKLYRAGLGLVEGPLPAGCYILMNNWLPPKEKGIATGAFTGTSKFGAVLAPPIGAYILVTFGDWRPIFWFFAIPGLILTVLWYFMITDTPAESKFVSPAELEYIQTGEDINKPVLERSKPKYNLAWLDKLIRAKKVDLVDTSAGVFKSWDIMGNAIAYFFMIGIFNVIMAWIPTYLVTVKGFATIKMGFLASAPFIGAVAGNFCGGIISDRLLNKRRKPLQLLTTLSTSFMMYSLVYAPNNETLLGGLLFLTGFLLSIGYWTFSTYPMGLTTKKTYGLAYSVANTGGQIGGALIPIVIGMILDNYNWDAVFLFLAASSIVSFLILTTLVEPINDIATGESA
jgi:ACS family glucarate transporter-like MFS transporter